MLRTCFLASLAVVGAGCHLLVDVPTPRPRAAAPDVAPLSNVELLRFTWENLGEVSPGLLYRSARPTRSLLEFLADRCRLGHLIDLRSGTDPDEAAFMDSIGGTVTHISMRASRPPRPRQVLEMIRVTHRALADGRSVLIHCRGGADRTGGMVALWRILFQGVEDRPALLREALLHRHLRWSHPNVDETIVRFRPELFMPFVRNPALLDDEEAIARLERSYYRNQPLLSGRTGTVAGPLRAGVGKADLLEGWEGPVPLATYGPLPGTATGVREAVFARALVLEAGGMRVAVVSCDLMVIDPILRSEVIDLARARGVDVDDVLLHATHTHTSAGGYVDHRLAEFYIMGRFREAMRRHLAARIADAVSAAVASRRPARIGFGRTFVEGFNRNRVHGDAVDTEVGVIRIDEADGRPLALAVNFAAHPVLEPADGSISPDYPGLLARRLDERFGFGLFLQGALGDLNASPGGGVDAWITEGLAEKVAAALSEAVEEAAASIETRAEVELGSMTALIAIPPVNINLVPDLLFPLDWALGAAAEWPRFAPIQTMRIGECALVACSTEIGARLGRQIKRRSPAPWPFVLTHSNGYAGYALTPVVHARNKLDPTSVMSNNGPMYGPVVVQSACDLLEALWGRGLEPAEALLSPAGEELLRRRIEEQPASDPGRLRAAAIEREERELLVREDVTRPQTRRHRGLTGDSLDELARVSVAFFYLDGARGGDGLEGRIRDVDVTARLRLPLDVRIDVGLGYRRADWDPVAGEDSDEGARDLAVGLERPFTVSRTPIAGTALRLIPRVSLTAPTGDPEPLVPFAFAAGSGVWRPGIGGAVELVWETHRVLTAETLLTTSTEGHDGRRPGERWEFALGYRERHGLTSLSLEWWTAVLWPDDRRGGRLPVDVDEHGFQMDVRPGLTVHLGERVDLDVRGIFPLARSGRGAGQGRGVLIGLTAAF